MADESALSVDVKKIGIIGAGGMGQVRAKALAATPKARLYAVASRSVKSSSRLAKAFNVSTAVGSYKELEGVGLDAVIVTTPPCFHYEITRWALENGFDVLVEGPICTKVSEGEKLAELAERKGARARRY